MRKGMHWVRICLVLVVALGVLTLSGPGERPVFASSGSGTLAYVLPNDDTGDEIHFINADGSGDQKIWSTGKTGTPLAREVHSLTWKPDASELAFVSSFQAICSIYVDDIFTVRANGTGLRRQTAPFGCGPNPGLPTGTVELTVNSYNVTGVFIIYLQGAPAPQSIPMGPYESKVITFTNVMDYGDNVIQYAAGLVGYDRYLDAYSNVNVIPGQTVHGTLNLIKNSLTWFSPTYSGDGQYLAYLNTPYYPYYAPSNHATPGGIGWLWQKNPAMTDSPSHMQWIGDAPDQSVLLYLGYKIFHDSGYGYGFYVADHTGSTLLTTVGGPVSGMAKLPDNTGLIFSMYQDMGNWDPDHGGCVVQWVGNIYEYDFATGEITQLSQFDPRPSTDTQICPPGPFPYELTISPDGSQIAFELQNEGDWMDATHTLDLWIMDRDGSNAHELVPNGMSPAFSPANQLVMGFTFIPMMRR